MMSLRGFPEVLPMELFEGFWPKGADWPVKEPTVS